MDLDFSEEQHMLREMVRGVCSEYAPLDVVREMEDDATGYPAEFWKQLGELGLIGDADPEEYGGGGQGMLEAADRLRGVRPRAGADAPLRQRGDLRRGAAARPGARPEARSGCRRSPAARRS